jgi:ubiquinone/menaquinone biosynthesis C-methylase UbiE
VRELRTQLPHRNAAELLTEADRIARAYSDLEARAGSRWDSANPGNQAILAERRRWMRRLLDPPLTGKRILEVGSGTGGELAWLVELGATPSNLVGVDLLADRVATARRAHPGIRFEAGNAEHLDFADATFDLVLAFTIFSSILDGTMQRNVAVEMTRVLRASGAVLWYDVRYDSNSNPNVKAVPASRVRELFPSLKAELHSVTLLPPLARRLGPVMSLYPALASIPPLRSHLFGLLRKP